MCYQHTAQMAQFRATGIISSASQNLTDVPLYASFDGDVRFGRYNPPNKGYSVVNTTTFSLISGSIKYCVKVDCE